MWSNVGIYDSNHKDPHDLSIDINLMRYQHTIFVTRSFPIYSENRPCWEQNNDDVDGDGGRNGDCDDDYDDEYDDDDDDVYVDVYDLSLPLSLAPWLH